MNHVRLGATGLTVSQIGFGAMHFDGIDDETEVSRLLNSVLDEGISLIDTARGYGRSEERIGRHLSTRRNEFVLSTKFGYGVDSVPDWTYPCIKLGVERALRLLNTEVIDVGFLHSCPLEILQRGEVTQALADNVSAGNLRFAGYSGENAELAHALADERFSVVQTSLSLVDQANRALLNQKTTQGVFAKRILGGIPWTRGTRPDDYCEGIYWDRWGVMKLPNFEMPHDEVFTRFSAHHCGADVVLLGSKRIENLRRASQAVAAGPLPADVLTVIEQAWTKAGIAWPGIV